MIPLRNVESKYFQASNCAEEELPILVSNSATLSLTEGDAVVGLEECAGVVGCDLECLGASC